MTVDIRIRSLILAGGRSSRMGSPKYLLPTTVAGNTAPFIAKTLLAHQGCRRILGNLVHDSITVSTRDPNQNKELQSILSSLILAMGGVRLEYIVDLVTDCGPGSGLTGAHELDADAHWLVTGCDYPLLETEALSTLADAHAKGEKAVTAFRNADGWPEPLLAVWSPVALHRLRDLSRENPSVGPARAIRELLAESRSAGHVKPFSAGVEMISPLKAAWLKNVNTKEDWDEVQAELSRDI